MRNIWVLWRREFAACFLSPTAYVAMVVFLAATEATFLAGLTRNAGGRVPMTSLLFGAIVLWLTVLVTAVTMRLFAEEKRAGTIESLMTAPVTDAEVVLGKYAGALSFVLIAVTPAVASAYVLAAMCPGIKSVDGGALAGGCLILALVAALSVAIGLMVSLMTRHPIVAAVSCFCMLWMTLLLGYFLSILPVGTGNLAERYSALVHVEDFARGAVDTRTVVLYVSVTAFLLFAAVRALETRRWR